MLSNVKTTLAGYTGIFLAVAGLLTAVAGVCTGASWCAYLGILAMACSDIANGVGNIASKDGGH